MGSGVDKAVRVALLAAWMLSVGAGSALAADETPAGGLEEVVVACQDTTQGPSRFLVQRELYDRTLAITHALQDLLKVLRDDGLTDAIHFWRNVHIRFRKPAGRD